MRAAAWFSPSMAVASASATWIRICSFGVLHCDFALERRCLLADRLFLFERRDRHRLLALGFARADRLFLAGVGDLNRLIALGGGDAGFAHLLVVGHVAAGLLNGERGGLLADGVDVARLVGDVGDVDVDELQADLGEFGLERMLHVLAGTYRDRG